VSTARAHRRVDDRDAVLSAFALASPYSAARLLGLTVAKGATPRSRSVRVVCPWHGDRNPSCDVTIRRGRMVAYCRSCNTGGDVLDIVAAIEGLDVKNDFRRVLERAAAIVGVELTREEPNAPRPVTPLDVARAQVREAQRERDAAEAAARALREECGIVAAEGVSTVDGLRATIEGLSETITETRATLPALRAAAATGGRRAIADAVARVEDALGVERTGT
jgi:pyruvate/2-oxoglutarate dehydrogenase complex dihydrolipoamide acyltransferase (E2) component